MEIHEIEFEKNKMITAIIQACAINEVNGLDDIFINLLCLDISELKKVCSELYIKTD